MKAPSKTATKRAIKALPALRASIIWFKRELIRDLKAKARDSASPSLQRWYIDRAHKIRTTDLADLRQAYQNARVSEIRAARRFELTRVVPGIVWMGGAS